LKIIKQSNLGDRYISVILFFKHCVYSCLGLRYVSIYTLSMQWLSVIKSYPKHWALTMSCLALSQLSLDFWTSYFTCLGWFCFVLPVCLFSDVKFPIISHEITLG
jgi:hypothetical protein